MISMLHSYFSGDVNLKGGPHHGVTSTWAVDRNRFSHCIMWILHFVGGLGLPVAVPTCSGTDVSFATLPSV